ncbi:MAG: hypothetical protein WCJ01_02965 [Ignavibacteria bacterium]
MNTENYPKIILIILTLLCVHKITAQEDYKSWLNKENEEYQSFLSEDDKKYYEFLKQEWKPFDMNKGEVSDKKPKPAVIPRFNNPSVTPQKQLNEKSPDGLNPVIKEPEPPSQTKPAEERAEGINKNIIPETSAEPAVSKNIVSIDYYDEKAAVSLPPELNVRLSGEMNNSVIAGYWKSVSNQNMKEFIESLNAFKRKLSLNDWGYFRFVWEASKKINNDRKNESLLLTWVALLKSGYKVKAGLINKDLVLLVKSRESIFNISYIKDKSGEKTYIIDFETRKGKNEGRLFTYEDDYTGADKYLSLKLAETPKLKENLFERDLAFSFNSKEYHIKVSLNKNIVDYYRNYPNTQYDTFFDAAVSGDVQQTLVLKLKEYTKDFSREDAINFLLRFVQTAFNYKTDEDNFGREKSLFVEETLFYPYSDCEDRAILFAYLTRTVLNLKAVGIDYPGHMATAVLCNNEIKGDRIKFRNNEYLICDPTYINADAGISMPAHPVSSIENVIEIK